MGNKPLYLNIDVSSKFNSSRDGHQVIHVETHPDSFYVIGACFTIKGEQRLNDDRKFYEEVIITDLVLRNLSGQKKKIKGSRIEWRDNYDYHFVVELEDDSGGPIESSLKPNLKFKRCVTDSSFDVTIEDHNRRALTSDVWERVGPKICQFRST